MKFYSWNVNGMRAVIQKGFWDWFHASDADVVGLQEIKAEPEQLSETDRNPAGYEVVWNPSRKRKGYSGTAAFYRTPPLSISHGLPNEAYNSEGRCILLEYPSFYFFNIYYPNGQKDDERLRFKLGYYDCFLEYAQELRKKKPIVACGDFNTAHKPIDLKRPKENEKTSGFLPVERAWIDKFVAHGYVDTFRLFNQEPEQYSWWSYRFGSRARNTGWRIDYFFVSEELRGNVTRSWIEQDVLGSDHCPVGLELNLDS
ncbi:MAG: exodeoxyribonuclease III [Proteobacteria bacterium]|nr:exodeoxyribonuclease III [Pseudomonadota bacterium]